MRGFSARFAGDCAPPAQCCADFAQRVAPTLDRTVVQTGLRMRSDGEFLELFSFKAAITPCTSSARSVIGSPELGVSDAPLLWAPRTASFMASSHGFHGAYSCRSRHRTVWGSVDLAASRRKAVKRASSVAEPSLDVLRAQRATVADVEAL
jgi:hypothetical protein